jgi:hypothetical protein
MMANGRSVLIASGIGTLLRSSGQTAKTLSDNDLRLMIILEKHLRQQGDD